ncbi:MAG TPA: HEAT repeat domain-containing protein, partial [Methanosarcina sp.]|nr:HEAT repeat domain-containing protein [Methanosarcina sp.]
MRLTGDESEYIRGKAADTLVSIFPDMPNKEIVWIDLLSLTRAKDEYVRNTAANALKLVFPYLGKKDFAWKELIELAGDKDEYVRRTAAETLSKVSPHMPKDKAYSDLANLAKKSVNYRLRELATLAADYPQLFYNYDSRGRKLEEMKENIELRDGTKIDEEKLIGVKELSSERFVNLPEEAVLSDNSDKKQYNWSEVLKLAEARDTKVRRHTADLLARIFSDVKTRPGVFFDLVKLTESQDAHIRKKAAELFPVAFEYSDEKQKVWDELVRLTLAVDRVVRREAVLALSSGYAEVSDKDKAWKDLVRLSNYRDNFVKRVATRALGNAFFYVIDKTEAWRDLEKVQANSYIFVRKYAFRSLGIASLWKSLRAENEVTYIFGIKEAIKFFIEADKISTDTNIPDF